MVSTLETNCSNQCKSKNYTMSSEKEGVTPSQNSEFDVKAYNSSVDIHTLPVFTRSQLLLYNGIDKPQIYTAIRGFVYDVTANKKNYGPGKAYHKLVGMDVSRMLGLNTLLLPASDKSTEKSWYIDDFTESQHQALDKWVEFFKKRYRIVGVVVDHHASTP